MDEKEFTTWRQDALNAIEAGTAEVQDFINQKYAERMTHQEGQMEMMKMLLQHGDTEAALELGRMILQHTSDRDMLRDLVARRNDTR